MKVPIQVFNIIALYFNHSPIAPLPNKTILTYCLPLFLMICIPLSSSQIVYTPQDVFTGYQVQSIDGNESRYYDVFISGEQIILMKRFIGIAILDNETYTQPTRIRYRDSFGEDNLININGLSDRLVYDIPQGRRPLWMKFGENSIIIVGTTSYNATLRNITQEPGFVHLNISDPRVKVYFPFDVIHSSNNITYDYTNDSNDGTITNGAIWSSAGVYGGAYILDGVNDFILLSQVHQPTYNGNYSYSFWINANQSGTYGLYSATEANQRRVTIELQSDGKIRFLFSETAVNFQSLTAGNLNAGTWYHVVISHSLNANNTRVIINGVNQTTTVISDSATGNPASATQTSLGRRFFGASDEFFNGSIDEFMYFNDTAITITEAQNIYNNQSSRFFPYGNMSNLSFSNINLSSNNTVNISLQDCQTYQSSVIQADINNEGFQNFVGCSLNGYQVTGNVNTLNLTIRLLAGQSSSLTFYSPVIIGNITLDSYFITPPQPPAGNFTCNLGLVYDSRKVPQLKHFICERFMG